MTKGSTATTSAGRLPAFQKFIDRLREIWAAEPDMRRRMERAQPLLRELVGDADTQKRSADWPSTEGRKNLLFYVDPDYGFAINGVVRVPGRRGSVHDHASAWVLYGVLTGAESLERYRRVDDGSKPGYADIELTSVTEGSSGKVDLVPPWDIHAEQGGPGRSTAVILRSEKLGEVDQNTFDRETGKIATGPGPSQIPYELTA
jgi:predicted metal-dependent enzyme (double-stranded beta helix superfamily)